MPLKFSTKSFLSQTGDEWFWYRDIPADENQRQLLIYNIANERMLAIFLELYAFYLPVSNI